MYASLRFRVLLIGGTSHTGKSTLARSLAQELGWETLSTDTLARHPGRPWKLPPERVPDHVVEHYRSLLVEELITDVLNHYEKNVWSIVEPLVASHVEDHLKERIVIEGSAVWPGFAVKLNSEHIFRLWLTASDEFIANRIYQESRYHQKSHLEKVLIDKFVQRSLVYNAQMMEIVNRFRLTAINVEKVPSLDKLTEMCLDLMRRVGF